jgi:MFS family permease
MINCDTIQNVKQRWFDFAVPVLSSKRVTELRGSTSFIVFTISLAVFTDIFLYAVIVPVIPFAFTQRMGLPEDQVQSSVSKSLAVYSAGLVVGSVMFGYLCDKMKNRRFSMLSGLLVLIAATIILCLTPSVALFMVGRVIQGLSAAVVWTVGLAVIADTAKPHQVAYLMAFPGIGMNMGMFCGPLVGGIVYDRAGYYPVFYVCFGILVVDVVLRLLMIEKRQLPDKLKKFEQYDRHPSSARTHSNTLLSDSSPEDPERQTDAGADSQIEQVAEEVKTTPTPYNIHNVDTLFGFKIFPVVGLLKHSAVLIVLFQALMIAWIMTSFESTMTIHLNDLFNFTSLGAALMFLALAAPSFLEPLVGKLSDKIGPRWIVSLAFVFLTPMIIILRLPNEDTVNQIVLFAALVVLVGVGLALLIAPVMGELSNVVTAIEEQNPGKFGPGKGYGQAYGLFNVAFSLGSLIGPFHAGGVFENQGWNMTVLSLGIATAVSVIPSVLFTGGNLLYKAKNRS